MLTGGRCNARKRIFTKTLHGSAQSLPGFAAARAIFPPFGNFRPGLREIIVDFVFAGAFLVLLLLTFALVKGCAALEGRK